MKQIALIGSWGADIQGVNKPGAGEGGVASFRMDERDGRLQLINRAAPTVNAGGLCITSDYRFAYSTDERKDIDGHHGSGGGICAYRIEDDGSMTFLNAVSSAGAYPCYCTVDSKSRFVFAVNHGNHEEVVSRSVQYPDGSFGCERVYDEGSIGLFPIRQDGSLGPCCELVGFRGHGVKEWFQWTSHPHSVLLDPTERFVLVGDKGCDLIRVFAIDYENAKLNPLAPGRVPDETGARHLAFHPSLPVLYCNGEQNNTVNVFSYVPDTMALTLLQTINTLPADYVARVDPADPFAFSQTADMRVKPDGKALYVSNRGDDSIACFSIGPDGTLSMLECVPCGGTIPRAINLDKTGTLLYSVNQRSGTVAVFHIDHDSGKLSAAGVSLSVNNPASIQFACKE